MTTLEFRDGEIRRVEVSEEAVRRLGYHPTMGPEQQALYEENRRRFMEMFTYVEGLSGRGSREISLALTKLQESLMWANAYIACNDVTAYGAEWDRQDG